MTKTGYRADMVIDTSALIAILLKEPEAAHLTTALVQAETKYISAANYLESAIVMFRRSGDEAMQLVDRLIAESGIGVVSVIPEQIEVACEAYRKFGKGRHPANLNFGHCFAYALAMW